ncbi:HNH endonuclease [Pediococcus damnosus LMG 28219]|uniref:AP2 domain-containing protein n=1 Tax=Pediococcus damnosus TaxID=51663 RepID=UPI00061E2771|nr:AP2 domain-containing protein [Pediococcus damnosus]KJU75145.1 HNH endonuclease [Pediococcus damnosus LMG 28219]PIO80792.1 AP2 domain-containing protein [Pediococcus damnosus]
MIGVNKRGKYWIVKYQSKTEGVAFKKCLNTEQEAIELRKKWEKEYGIPNRIRKDRRGNKIGNFLIIDYVPENHKRVLVKNLITNEFQERDLRQVVNRHLTGIPRSIANREAQKHEGVGTYFIKSSNKWRAMIQINGKNKHLGYFLTQEEAIAARKTAEQKYLN